MLEKKDRDINSNPKDVSEDPINALTNEDLPLYARVTLANQDNDGFKRICKALSKNLTQIFKLLNLKHCSSHNKALFFKSKLWVPPIPTL